MLRRRPIASLEDVASIRQIARGALLAADAMGRVPTPLEDVGEALRLNTPQALFDLADAPPGILAAARRLAGKLLGALDVRERTIYLDRSQHPARQRFNHGHELGHDALPWHRAAYFGDDHHTLNPDTADLLEAEASVFSAETLFQVDRFTEEANGFRLGLEVPLGLAKRWDVSRHAAMRRYVETSPRTCALLLIGRYPVAVEGGRAVRVLASFESVSFRRRFGIASQRMPAVLDENRYGLAVDAIAALSGELKQPVAAGRLALDGSLGAEAVFEYEVTSNTYSAFVLVFERPRIQSLRRMRTLWTPGTSQG